MALDRDRARRCGAPFAAYGMGADDLLIETGTRSSAVTRVIGVNTQAVSAKVAWWREE